MLTIRAAVRELNVSQIDLLLIHLPFAESSASQWPKRERAAAPEVASLPDTAALRLATWRAMLRARAQNFVRNLGVSNFNGQQIDELRRQSGEMPAVNQFRNGPDIFSRHRELHAFCQLRGIRVMAYNVLAVSSSRRAAGSKQRHAALARIADARNMTRTQVLIRWGLDVNMSVLIASSSAAHLSADLEATEAAPLAANELAALAPPPYGHVHAATIEAAAAKVHYRVYDGPSVRAIGAAG